MAVQENNVTHKIAIATIEGAKKRQDHVIDRGRRSKTN
jgi:hypothetical protein